MEENEITEAIIGCAIKVHRKLGPGLLESVYEECLAYEIRKAGFSVERQKSMPVIYDKLRLEAGFRLDLLIEQRIVVELKAVESLNDVHMAQVLTYLRLADCRLGLLINLREFGIRLGLETARRALTAQRR